jgi:hypothetical protein
VKSIWKPTDIIRLCALIGGFGLCIVGSISMLGFGAFAGFGAGSGFGLLAAALFVALIFTGIAYVEFVGNE